MSSSLKRKNNRGFTLIEALIAIFILSIGILTVAKLQGSSVKGDAKAGDITRASLLASDTIEDLLSLDFIDTKLSDDDIHFPVDNCEEKLCVAWKVIDDMPFQAIIYDTDEETELPEALTVSKTVQVVIYENDKGYAGENVEDNVLHMNFIKTRSL